MNDVVGVDLECGSDPCLTRGARCHLVAGVLQARTGRPEDRPTHPTASSKVSIRCVHDRTNTEWEDDEVANEDFWSQRI